MPLRLIHAFCAKVKPKPIDRRAYRNYRIAILGMPASTTLPSGAAAEAFRQRIIDSRLPDASIEASEWRMIRIALGLPRYAPLRPNWSKSLGFVLLGMILPERVAIGLTVSAIRATRTKEGRDYLYSRFLCRLNGCSSLRWYGAALELALTQVEGVRSVDQLLRLTSYNQDLIAAGLQLGLRDADMLATALEPLRMRIGGPDVRVLVDERVIEHDFGALEPYLDAGKHHYSLTAIPTEGLRATIRHLKQAGLPPARLLGLVNASYFEPDKLERVLQILARHGISDVTTVFDHLGPHLWSIQTDVLEYVIAELGAADGATLVQFTEVLRAYRAPAPDVARALIARGATPAQLAQCQRFLIEAGKLGRTVLERLDILMALPYALAIADLDQCAAYLKQDEHGGSRFDDFLEVLARHQLASREAIVAFGPELDAIGQIAGVDLRLTILGRHIPLLPMEDAVAWVRSSQGGHPASLRYLGLDAGLMLSDVSDLAKVADLAKMSPCLLRYLVDERGVRTLVRLHDWYYSEGSGVDAYHGGETCDDTERLLFRDCSKRGSFYRLMDNARALVGAVSQWIDGRLVAPGPGCEQADRETYWAARASLRVVGRQAAASHIDEILAATDGILLESVLLDGLGGSDVATVLQGFAPLTASLLMGKGAAQVAPTPMALECIRLVYGASQERIESLWDQVSGFQDHLRGLSLADIYPVQLRLSTSSLAGASQAVYDGIARSLSALTQAARAASRADRSATDLLLAAPWKHMGNQAATLADLERWLAFLLKLGSASGDVAKWIDQKLDNMRAVLSAPETAAVIEREFSQFIAATLPDALADALPAYLGSTEFVMRQDELRALAAKRKLDPAQLPEAVRAMVELVLKVAGRLPAQLRAAMTKSEGGEEFRGHAVVSKDPAAFFAKDAFELCSKDDTQMWAELRHSHLLIFDPRRKRLVGMAMLYVQSIPGYADNGRCLVIRAVNVGTVGLRKFDPVSVLDETKRIAIEIARANGLEAILFPQGSTHFSNQDDIVKALHKSQFGKHARPLTLQGGVFYCREHGRQRDAFQKLQLAWERTGDDHSAQIQDRTSG